MSRPPTPRGPTSTVGRPSPDARTIDYLPAEHGDMLALQRALARDLPGYVESAGEADPTDALFDLSALVGHTLALYQDRYGADAFLATAVTPEAVRRHARRLGAEPAPAMSARGYVRLDVAGDAPLRLDAGLSVSAGAQDFETLDPVTVSAAWNEMLPCAPMAPWGDAAPPHLDVPRLGLGLSPGDLVVLSTGDVHHVRTLLGVEERRAARCTRLTTVEGLPRLPDASEVTLRAAPRVHAHLLGWDFPQEVTDADLRRAAPPTSFDAGWEASPGAAGEEFYLDEELRCDASEAPIVRLGDDGAAPYVVTHARRAHVAFTKPMGMTSPPLRWARVVTALTIPAAQRANEPPRTSVWLLDWRVREVVPWLRPNVAPADGALVLSRLVPGLAQGQLVCLERRPEAPGAPLAEIARLTAVSTAQVDGAARSEIRWRVVQRAPGQPSDHPWTVGEVVVRGNVASASHGRTCDEVLGDSDGATALLRFALKKAPVAHLAEGDGVRAAVEVRVGGARWDAADGFDDAGPNDRRCVLVRGADGALTVAFGDGQRGAIPPAGRRHITARYRVGAGAEGNVAAGAISRVRTPHPRVSKAVNPLPMTGGSDPLDLEAMRRHATVYLRTFDRAVAVEDYDDLALRFPGVAQARASWGPLGEPGVRGVRLVVADAAGGAPDIDLARGRLRRFLDARRDPAVPLEIVAPRALPLRLALHVDVDPAFERPRVEEAVRAAFCASGAEAPGLFTFAGRSLGQPAFLSEVYARVERVPGVTVAQVQRFGPASAGDRVEPVIAAPPDAWLRLAPGDLTFVPMERPQ